MINVLTQNRGEGKTCACSWLAQRKLQFPPFPPFKAAREPGRVLDSRLRWMTPGQSVGAVFLKNILDVGFSFRFKTRESDTGEWRRGVKAKRE